VCFYVSEHPFPDSCPLYKALLTLNNVLQYFTLKSGCSQHVTHLLICLFNKMTGDISYLTRHHICLINSLILISWLYPELFFNPLKATLWNAVTGTLRAWWVAAVPASSALILWDPVKCEWHRMLFALDGTGGTHNSGTQRSFKTSRKWNRIPSPLTTIIYISDGEFNDYIKSPINLK